MNDPNADTLDSPRQRPCDVGVVFALAIEAGGFEDRLSGVLAIEGTPFTIKFGGLQGRHVVVVHSGAGREAATRATDALIAGHHPRLVISAGFAGGLNESLKRGEFLLPDRLLDTRGNSILLPNLNDQPGLKSLRDRPDVHVGALLSADRIISSPAEKRALGEKYSALAVDLETMAVATICRREQTPFAAVRIISDAVDDELPPDLDHLLKQQSTMGRLGAAAGAIFRRPSSLKEMWKLKETAIAHSDRLAKFLEGLIAELSSSKQQPLKTKEDT